MSFFKRLFSKKGEGESPERSERLRASRLHPYRFAHYALRDRVFEDPAVFDRTMHSEEARAWLYRLWSETGSKVAFDEGGRRVSANGLELLWGKLGDLAYPIVVMPPPQIAAEAFFIGIVPPRTSSEETRFFVLEREESSTPQHPAGLLCEWYADGKRSNHLMLIAAKPSAFENAITHQFRDEDRRREAGVVPIRTPSWRPEDEPAALGEDRVGHFRPQHVLFSYHVVLKAAERLRERPEPALVDELWNEAGALCASSGLPSNVAPEGLDAQTITIGEQPFLIITLPEPLGAPEAYFIALSLSEDGSIYTLERPSTRRGSQAIIGLLMEDRHAISSFSDDESLEGFLDALEHLFQGASRGEPPYEMVGHLTVYRQVFSLIRTVAPDLFKDDEAL